MRHLLCSATRRRAIFAVLTTWTLIAGPSVSAQAIDLARYSMVDLTHELASNATAWPGSRDAFKLDTIRATESGAMFRLTLNEHFATHLDAPRHASGTGWTNERIPLDRLIAPLVIIDVRAQAARDRDYALLPADVVAHERAFGRIPRGAIVVLRTGWARYWDNAQMYFGTDTTVKPNVLHFPSFGVEAAQLLVARGVAMLGVDSPSTDIGKAPTFAVHGILGAANVPALENLANCNALPPTGAVLLALPILTRGGSGGPVRVVALVPRK
ncbi:MAG: cyclase family protein [Gemmatimonadaceae bacterium]|nr:cyclase family protein [Gemmatimonadaceae bacterium]